MARKIKIGVYLDAKTRRLCKKAGEELAILFQRRIKKLAKARTK
jgi:hypothetical protein